MIEHNVGVAFVTGSENDDFADEGEFSEELYGEGTHVDPCIYLFTVGKLYFEGDIVW